MAQVNAAQEPTMEDILNSIRQIIEKSDPDSGHVLPVDAQRQQNEMAEKVTGSDQPVVTERAVSNSSAEKNENLKMAASSQRDADQVKNPFEIERQNNTISAPLRPISLAEVAARVRAEAKSQEERIAIQEKAKQEEEAHQRSLKKLSEQQEKLQREIAQQEFNTPVDEIAVEEAPKNSGYNVDSQPIIEQPAFEHPVFEQPTFASAPVVNQERTSVNEAINPSAAPVVSSVDASLVAANNPAPQSNYALISAQAQSQVSASFENLNDALRDNMQTSLDDVAEEILRPMLKEWLDDNLPTLVERLVREEISRVARGS